MSSIEERWKKDPFGNRARQKWNEDHPLKDMIEGKLTPEELELALQWISETFSSIELDKKRYYLVPVDYEIKQ